MFSPDKWLANPSTGFYGHTLDQSLRFEDGDHPSLTKTYDTAQTNTKKITISVWVKRANISNSRSTIILGRSGGAGRIAFENNNTLLANAFDTGYNGFTSSALFRDVSAWYHIVYQGNSDTSTLADINKVYVNGVQQTNANSSSLTPQNSATNIIRNGIPTYIGKDPDSDGYYFDGYLAELNVIDGSVVAPTEFAETKDGIWIPKAYSGSYGTNGFYMTFQGTGTATTTAGDTAQINIGDDQSGNGRNFAVSGLASSDVMTGESPTNNFATLNPLAKGSGTITFSEGNLKSSTAGSVEAAEHGATFTIPKSGKWYWEAAYTGALTNGGQAAIMGIMDIDTQIVGLSGNHLTNTTGDYVTYYSHSSSIYENNGNPVTGIGNEAAATVGFALDMDNGYLFVHLNGTYISGTPNFSTGANHAAEPNTTRTWLPFFGANGGLTVTWRANFGQDSEGISSAQSPDDGIGTFEYDVPAGYKALCSQNLPDVEIIDGSEHFNTVLFTGTSNVNSVTGIGFSPNFSWLKQRNSAQNHGLFDSVRGANKFLMSNDTEDENTRTTDTLSSFDSDGFTLTAYSSDAFINYTGRTMVAWNWLAGGSASTIAADSISSGVPSIASSVSANTTAGFSIVSLTTPASGAFTFGHGLGVQPDMIIAKGRETDGYSWLIYHRSIGAGVNLVFSPAAEAANTTVWQNTNPTSSIVYGNSTSWGGNEDYIAYCFASTVGFSKAGIYSGGSSVFPFVFTGFRPAWVMLKRTTDGSYHWRMYDSKRSPFNEVDDYLTPNLNFDEKEGLDIDFLSNGFKIRTSNDDINDAAKKYVYLAFAEAPFKFANAR